MDLRWISLFAVLLLVAAPVVPAKTTSMRLPYEGSAPVTYQGVRECDSVLPLGVVCLDVRSGDQDVVFKLVDKTGLAVGGTWWVHDANGVALDGGSYCGGASVDLPRTDGLLVVRVDTLNGPIGCVAEGRSSVGPATMGFVEFAVR